MKACRQCGSTDNMRVDRRKPGGVATLCRRCDNLRRAARPENPMSDLVPDDRIQCVDCRAHDAFTGQCRAARTKYFPLPNLLKRCECFTPRPDVADQRNGPQRWPELVGSPGGPLNNPYPANEFEQEAKKRRGRAA